jgi:hypothetical protein
MKLRARGIFLLLIKFKIQNSKFKIQNVKLQNVKFIGASSLKAVAHKCDLLILTVVLFWSFWYFPRLVEESNAVHWPF